LCEGARLVLTDRASFEPLRTGITIATVLAKFDGGSHRDAGPFTGNFQVAGMIALVGNAETIRGLAEGDLPGRIAAEWNADINSFRKMRAKYLLYQ
jgi:uncharacterized protein YbbC (DUF1343 family)